MIRAPDTPSASSTVASTASASSRVSTWVGSTVPEGNDSASRSEAEIASGLSRNWSAWSSPVSIRNRPSDMTASSSRVPVTNIAGRAATRSPTRRHSDRVSTSAGSPTCGTRGQNTHRPKSTSAAGSTTSTKDAAITTPIAQATPRPRVVGTSESSRVSRPSTTVVALESTASAVRRTATAIAWCRDSWDLSSSR